MGLVQVVAPSVEPVSLAELKAQSRITQSDEDSLISTQFIPAARSYVESRIRRQLITADWRLSCAGFTQSGALSLPRPPLQSVVSVTYYDVDNVLQTLASSVYGVFADTGVEGRMYLESDQEWPEVYDRPDAVQVLFRCGYGLTSADVPIGIRQAILLVAADLFEHRENSESGRPSNAVILSAERLVEPYELDGS